MIQPRLVFANVMHCSRVKKLFKFKKFVPWSVFVELQLTQISLNFKTSCCNLKIRGLGAKLCVASNTILQWSEIWNHILVANIYAWLVSLRINPSEVLLYWKLFLDKNIPRKSFITKSVFNNDAGSPLLRPRINRGS